MGVKEDLERTVAGERERLGEQMRIQMQFRQRQRERFEPFRALLAALAGAADRRYLRVRLGEDEAIVRVGHALDEGYVDIEWRIEPNSSIRLTSDPAEEHGFAVRQRCSIYRPDWNVSASALVFDDEAQALAHILKHLAERIAFYERLEAPARAS